MSLPIKLSITGLLFDGEIALAYEGDPVQGSERKVHVCIMDKEDPWAPSTSRASLPPKDEEDEMGMDDENHFDPSDPTGDFYHPRAQGGGGTGKLGVGMRILPTIVIESEIGQTDKHVLKNVSAFLIVLSSPDGWAGYAGREIYPGRDSKNR